MEMSDDAREFIRLEAPMASWPVPQGLRDALDSLGSSLLARNRAALARWLGGGGCPRPVGPRLRAAHRTGPWPRSSPRLGSARRGQGGSVSPGCAVPGVG